MSKNKEILLATALLEDWKDYNQENRNILLKNIINLVDGNNEENLSYIILLPAGFYRLRKDDNFENYVKFIPDLLKKDNYIVLGLDRFIGENIESIKSKAVFDEEVINPDQYGIAISSDGIISCGKKFYPADEEETFLNRGEMNAGDYSYDRIFHLNTYTFYIAVCYDIFGLKNTYNEEMEMDVILNLIHGFTEPGTKGYGHSYFARHGLAGASFTWQVPVFASAFFFKNSLAEKFPCGVLNKKVEDTTRWKYEMNPIKPDTIIKIPTVSQALRGEIHLFYLK